MLSNQANEIKEFILKNVGAHPRDIASLTMEKFGVTRTTVHRHIKTLCKSGQLFKEGLTNSSVYFLKSSLIVKRKYKIASGLSESDVWAKDFDTAASKLPNNILHICYYGFTEIFNNAIDHSSGTTIDVESSVQDNKLTYAIYDNGIGIFKKLKEAFNFEDERDSILQLSKGKLTTDKTRHSGEGIFFTSRAFDSFCILSNGLFYNRDNSKEDWYIEHKDSKDHTGTVVQMSIDLSSKTVLRDIFEKFQNPETSAFDRTHIVVLLSLSKEDYFVSRSQAKRILVGVEKFNHVALDFKGVKAVGQAFVDEVYRVFQNRYPEIEITEANTNSDIEFMIKRGKATAQS